MPTSPRLPREPASIEKPPTRSWPKSTTKKRRRSSDQEVVRRGLECGLDENGKPLYLAKPGEPTDALGRPLPEDIYEAFEDAKTLLEYLQYIERICKGLAQMESRSIARHLDYGELDKASVIYRRQFTQGRPKCVCPSCHGTGRYGDKKSANCPTCKGDGWIAHGNYDALNGDLRGIAEGYRASE